jgi:hypothetical protein
MSDGHLSLSKLTEEGGRRSSIDNFFATLAETKEHFLGISATGST